MSYDTHKHACMHTCAHTHESTDIDLLVSLDQVFSGDTKIVDFVALYLTSYGLFFYKYTLLSIVHTFLENDF